jgi:hypothetical protein|tara:strand:+ start:365 stop:550 length:186 start_codon:yes stop_codon:yes gene_type:complete
MKKQVKSNYYYIFWGAATIAVVLGQLYVGSGYRQLHYSLEDLMQKVDGVLLHKNDRFNGVI